MVSKVLFKHGVFKVNQYEWFTGHNPIGATVRTDSSFWLIAQNTNKYKKYDKIFKLREMWYYY